MSFLYKLERRTTETEVENRDELGCTNEVKDLRNELKMLKNSFIRLEGIAVVNVSDITELTSTDNVEGNNENLLHEEVTGSQDICELEAEEKSQTATVTFTCLKCSATFVDRGLLEEHKAEQHTISCPLCTETFDNVDGLNLHMAGFHTPHCAMLISRTPQNLTSVNTKKRITLGLLALNAQFVIQNVTQLTYLIITV